MDGFDATEKVSIKMLRSMKWMGFLLHLQNQQKESMMTEDSGLQIYSNIDVDM